MRKFTSLLLAVGAAARSWPLGRPIASLPTTLIAADRHDQEPPVSIAGNDHVQRLPPLAALGRPVVHDSDFVPDHVLVVTYENTSIACQSRLSTLVNGSTPGPTLRLQPGKTSWVRVYNNMADYNLTMVGHTHISWHPL
jgi:FtsP/CotA-like multicopper oxidase with cupredoxin domain